MKKHFFILSTPGFIIGLILLLLNDWMLKDLFHNWATGKLSDFAGMFVFPLFWVALFPRLGKHAFWASAVWFIYWKSPYSQQLIDSWNSLGWYSIHRVLDLTDLMALVMVPLAYRYWKREPKAVPFRLHPVVPLGVAAFAFMATGRGREEIYPREIYQLPFPKDSLNKWIPMLENVWIVSGVDNDNPDNIRLHLGSSWFELGAFQKNPNELYLILYKASLEGSANDTTLNVKALKRFKEAFIDPLLEKHRTTQDSIPNIP